MKIFRVKTKDGSFYATEKDDQFQVITLDKESGEVTDTDCFYPAEAVSFMVPCEPSKVVAVGLNYQAHGQEMKEKLPEEPLIFLKPATAVIAAGDAIIRPEMSARVDYEAELGVVIKKRCRNVAEKDAKDYILGFTCVNDVTARDLQAKDGQWTRAKGFDTFCPIGPHIETDFDWRGKRLTAILNGRIVQDTNTDQMIFAVERLISFISMIMTLNPGDVIATGTPAGIGAMESGDAIAIAVEGIGTLTNPIR